jgi:cytoskeletal protein RodZ
VRLLERLNSPIAFAVALVLFLVLDGFLFYRYQQALQSTEDEVANPPVEDASASLKDETTVTEETSSSVEEEPTVPEETTPSPKEEQEGQGKNVPPQNVPAQNVPNQNTPDPNAPDPNAPDQLMPPQQQPSL